jgi:signal transduction histidine kinase
VFRPTSPERAQSLALAGLLGASVLLTALLAVQAHYAYAHHRRTAVQVLRDFAALAGNELGRRAATQLGYDGFMVALSALEARLTREGFGLPAAPADERARRAAALPRRLFAADPAEGRIAFDPGPPDAATVAWLRGALSESVPQPRPFRVLHRPGGTAFLVASTGPGRPWPLAGFEVDPAAVVVFLDEALRKGPLLPPSLGQGRVSNAQISIRVFDGTGVERLHAGGGPWPALEVEVPLGSAYGGALEGWLARVSLDPSAAHLLVIGGLPQSRLPVLLTLLGLSVALVAGALVLVRRERALARLREEFVASVSHELRTPLTQIRMYAETLNLGRVRSDAERERAVRVIDREARRLANLVENLLQFSRAPRRSETLAAEPRALAPLVRQALEAFRPLADDAGARLDVELDEAAGAAIDPDALQQVMLNLLDNAMKYGPAGQTVTVRLARRGDRVELSVSDQGPGIPASDRERVFERFHRLERDRRSARAGTGIGLSVVRGLAERHHGRAFAADGEKGGARVGVELPAAEVA